MDELRKRMKRDGRVLFVVVLPTLAAMTTGFGQAGFAVPLPDGVKAVWGISKAYRETTPTREKICINGLWLWQPARASDDQVPAQGWGYFKVPGCWPGITDYMQKDFQTVHAHPSRSEEHTSELQSR